MGLYKNINDWIRFDYVVPVKVAVAIKRQFCGSILFSLERASIYVLTEEPAPLL